MKKALIFFVSLTFSIMCEAQSINKVLYLIPGQGGDERLFEKIIEFKNPDEDETMSQYARRLSAQIDTNMAFSLVGVSLGGMIAVEMSKFLEPEKLIIISSAKTKDELPPKIRWSKYLGLHKILGGNFYKRITNLGRPLFEPDSRKNQEVFTAMINDKDPLFMQRAVNCVLNWDNTEYRKDIIHIHGSKDHVIPIRNVKNPIRIENGSHMMVLTEGEKISKVLAKHLVSDQNNRE